MMPFRSQKTTSQRPRWLFWAGLAVAALLIFVVAPLVLPAFRLTLLAKFFTFALVATGIGLAWGRGGMLTLGQGVYFGLGAYAMAMHLKLSDAAVRGDAVPDFMALSDTRELPGFWVPFANPVFTIAFILIGPALVAFAFGYLVFHRQVKGAYFAILSQALAAAAAIFLVSQNDLGGSNGLNRFQNFFGFVLNDPLNQQMLYFITGGVLLGCALLIYQLMHSRFGELLVAVRDQEQRIRFLGYNPALIKATAYAVAAFTASLGGALFVPVVGIISPSSIGVAPSLAFLIGVAIGGRETLLGPILGAIGIAWTQTALSETYPSQWTYFQGILFIVVVGFLPGGLASLCVARRRKAAPSASVDAEHTRSPAPSKTSDTADSPPESHAPLTSEPAMERTQ